MLFFKILIHNIGTHLRDEPCFESNSTYKLVLRPGVKSDVPVICELLREFIVHHRLSPDIFNEANISKYGFCENPLFKVELAEVDKKIVGLALYYFTYAGFLSAPELYLEDLYIKEEYRSNGIGKELLKKLAVYAQEKECCRMSWQVNNWNEQAINFYQKFGGQIKETLLVMGLSKKGISDLTSTSFM